jgi:type II secretory pathway pseudopilin PulG
MIELIVVCAIVAFLASFFLIGLQGAREANRDARRITDLKQVQQALQVYYIKCGMYPGEYDAATKGCLGGLLSAPSDNPDSWASLHTILSGAEINVESIPNDPISGQTYSYFVQLRDDPINTTPRAQCYVLRAQFETDHTALDTSVTDQDIVDKIIPSGSPLGAKNFFPQAPSCNPLNDEYCIGNVECFYGG